jgi:hypothetical protein
MDNTNLAMRIVSPRPWHWRQRLLSSPQTLPLKHWQVSQMDETAQVRSKSSLSILGESGNRVKLLFERDRSHAPSDPLSRSARVLAPNRNMSGAMEPLTNESIGQLTKECDRVPNTDSHIYLMGAANSPASGVANSRAGCGLRSKMHS